MDLPLNFVATLILGLLVVYPDATSGLDMESRESLPTESWISSYITWMKTDSIPHHPITAKHWKIHSRLRRAPNVVASSSPQHPIETDGGGVSTDMQFKHSTEYFPLPITSPTENRLVEKSTLKNMQVTHTNMSSTGSSGYSELPTSSIPSHTLEPQQSTHFTSMSTQESSSEQQEESQTELDSFTPESESTDDAETEDIETTLTDSSSDTNLENFVKKLMSNPKAADLDLKSTDTKEILRLLMKKRLLAQKMHDYAKNMDEGNAHTTLIIVILMPTNYSSSKFCQHFSNSGYRELGYWQLSDQWDKISYSEFDLRQCRLLQHDFWPHKWFTWHQNKQVLWREKRSILCSK